MTEKWYRKAYRRNVVDMHIMDWDERFLSEFDPQTYVATLKKSQAQSAVLYAHSHTGLTNYPTKYGQMHRALKGRNIFAETAEECRKNGIAVQLYFSLTHDTQAYRKHADWRVRHPDGTGARDDSRYGTCCPNSPYREYVANMVEELCELFEFEGIRFDMTFWSDVCYCIHCRNRFADEVGGELPTIINWDDPTWVAFQRKREDWLVEFAALATNIVKKHKPQASIEHQASTFHQNWRFGVSYKLAEQNTFLQGDFYGDAIQGSVARKLFYNLSENLPFGFETCFAVDLGNHTARKDKDLLRCKTYAAIADGGAFVFIDAIDPVGTLNPKTYEIMGEIFDETKRYEPYLGGERCQDVAIYLSSWSKYHPGENGCYIMDSPSIRFTPGSQTGMPHVDAVFSVASALVRNNIPHGVITKRNLEDLPKFKLLVLPNVLMMDDEEVEAIRNYVREGGCVYASKYTSLQKSDGTRPGDFMLADVLGVSYNGETPETFTYIAPTDEQLERFDGYTKKHPAGFASAQVKVSALDGAEVWGTTVLPYSDPADSENFVSIHSNPPGVQTNEPALVFNTFGKGKAIYSAVDLETPRIFDRIFIGLLRALRPGFSFEGIAPPPVEITAFHQPENKRYIVSLINFQKDLPNIPVDDIQISLRVAEGTVDKVLLLPDESGLAFSIQDGRVTFTSPRLVNFHMFAVAYK